jgi:glycerol-3-phosphate cytidylyltransferase-like family protein
MKGIIADNFDVIHPGYIEMFKQMKKIKKLGPIKIGKI